MGVITKDTLVLDLCCGTGVCAIPRPSRDTQPSQPACIGGGVSNEEPMKAIPYACALLPTTVAEAGVHLGAAGPLQVRAYKWVSAAPTQHRSATPPRNVSMQMKRRPHALFFEVPGASIQDLEKVGALRPGTRPPCHRSLSSKTSLPLFLFCKKVKGETTRLRLIRAYGYK